MKLFRTIHVVLGFCLCLLLAMWFLSGFVMIYHSYPRISRQTMLQKQLPIQGNLPSIQDLDSLLHEDSQMNSLSLQMRLNQPVFLFQSKGKQTQILAEGLQPIPEVTNTTLNDIRKQWNASRVLQVDTLFEIDQWTLPRKSADVFPIYKYTFDDENDSQLYLSSTTGKVFQYTTRAERVWAWLGAIPHWVYFTSLRENQVLWIEFVKWTSGVSCIMLFAGMILGIRIFWKSRKQSYRIPYKKRWYKWHYVLGLIFGLISITFAFSGLMSLIDLPDFLKKKHKTEQSISVKSNQRKHKSIDLDAFKLDYRHIIDSIENVKTLEWEMYNDKPYYRISQDEKTTLIDASISDKLLPMRLSEADIIEEIKQLHQNRSYDISLITACDDYYFNRRKERVPLPVYRVIIEDELHTRYYYNPETLNRQRHDDNTKLKRLLYNGLHSLHFKFLADRPILWNILMYVLLIGGSLLSITGLVLSFKWAYRKGKKYISKINTKQK